MAALPPLKNSSHIYLTPLLSLQLPLHQQWWLWASLGTGFPLPISTPDFFPWELEEGIFSLFPSLFSGSLTPVSSKPSSPAASRFSKWKVH